MNTHRRTPPTPADVLRDAIRSEYRRDLLDPEDVDEMVDDLMKRVAPLVDFIDVCAHEGWINTRGTAQDVLRKWQRRFE